MTSAVQATVETPSVDSAATSPKAPRQRATRGTGSATLSAMLDIGWGSFRSGAAGVASVPDDHRRNAAEGQMPSAQRLDSVRLSPGEGQRCRADDVGRR